MNESRDSSEPRENKDEALNGLLHSALNSEVPHDVERLMKGRLEDFRHCLDERDRARWGRSRPVRHPWRRLAWAGGVGAAAVAAVVLVFVVSQSPLSWARVVETFRSFASSILASFRRLAISFSRLSRKSL